MAIIARLGSLGPGVAILAALLATAAAGDPTPVPVPGVVGHYHHGLPPRFHPAPTPDRSIRDPRAPAADAYLRSFGGAYRDADPVPGFGPATRDSVPGVGAGLPP